MLLALGMVAWLFHQLNREPNSVAKDAFHTYQALKTKIHNRLINSLDLSALMQLSNSDALEVAIESTVHHLLDEEHLPLSAAERQKLARDVLNETLGLGPLEPLLVDPDVNDILVERRRQHLDRSQRKACRDRHQIQR